MGCGTAKLAGSMVQPLTVGSDAVEPSGRASPYSGDKISGKKSTGRSDVCKPGARPARAKPASGHESSALLQQAAFAEPNHADEQRERAPSTRRELTQQALLSVRVNGKTAGGGPTFVVTDPHTTRLLTTGDAAFTLPSRAGTKDAAQASARKLGQSDSPISRFKQRKRYGVTHIGNFPFASQSNKLSLDSSEPLTPVKSRKRIPQPKSVAELGKGQRRQQSQDYISRVNSLERRMAVRHRVPADIIQRIHSSHSLPRSSLRSARPPKRALRRKTSLEGHFLLEMLDHPNS